VGTPLTAACRCCSTSNPVGTTATVTDEQALRCHPGVAIVKSVDGVGSPALKRATWRT
jgi:hypothetical protein